MLSSVGHLVAQPSNFVVTMALKYQPAVSVLVGHCFATFAMNLAPMQCELRSISGENERGRLLKHDKWISFSLN